MDQLKKRLAQWSVRGHLKRNSAPEGIAERSAVGIQNGGWSKFDEVSADHGIPSGAVDPTVMRAAQQYAVIHRGVPVLVPFEHDLAVAGDQPGLHRREPLTVIERRTVEPGIKVW